MAVMKAMDLLVRILGQQFKTQLRKEVAKELRLQIEPLIQIAATQAVHQVETELHTQYSPIRHADQVFLSLLINGQEIELEEALEAIEADRSDDN